jgi:hypothetical protein
LISFNDFDTLLQLRLDLIIQESQQYVRIQEIQERPQQHGFLVVTAARWDVIGEKEKKNS